MWVKQKQRRRQWSSTEWQRKWPKDEVELIDNKTTQEIKLVFYTLTDVIVLTTASSFPSTAHFSFFPSSLLLILMIPLASAHFMASKWCSLNARIPMQFFPSFNPPSPTCYYTAYPSSSRASAEKKLFTTTHHCFPHLGDVLPMLERDVCVRKKWFMA